MVLITNVEIAMELVVIGIGAILLTGVAFYIHRRFGHEVTPRKHSNAKQATTYDQAEIAKAHAAGINGGSH